MKVTVDINVLLDVFQNRAGFYEASARVMALVAEGVLDATFPAHGITTLYYLVRRHGSRADAEGAMEKVLADYKVGNLDAAGWERARNLLMDDFEDAVVASVAETAGSEFIITRNTGDFFGSSVPAITPIGFLSQFDLDDAVGIE